MKVAKVDCTRGHKFLLQKIWGRSFDAPFVPLLECILHFIELLFQWRGRELTEGEQGDGFSALGSKCRFI